MRRNPNVTQKQILENAYMSRATLQREIKVLIAEGYIERVGATKKGEWIVKKYK